jgi:hypothetical protein
MHKQSCTPERKNSSLISETDLPQGKRKHLLMDPPRTAKEQSRTQAKTNQVNTMQHHQQNQHEGSIKPDKQKQSAAQRRHYGSRGSTCTCENDLSSSCRCQNNCGTDLSSFSNILRFLSYQIAHQKAKRMPKLLLCNCPFPIEDIR